jgi:hypothetical protein
MDTRDLWEEQVNLLTKNCRVLMEKVEHLEDRLTYFENVVIVLIKALKDGGVIVEEKNGQNSFDQSSEV